jgi:hypothetical protein
VAAGLDMTELVYQLAHGADPAPQVACKEGRLVRFLPGDLLWFLTSPDRFKDLGSFLDFWSANVSYQLTSARDPGPIMGYMLENLAILFDREARQSRFRRRASTLFLWVLGGAMLSRLCESMIVRARVGVQR